MAKIPPIWQSLGILLRRAVVGLFAGIVFSVLILGWRWEVAVNGAIIGALIGVFALALDRFLIKTRLRRRAFWLVLLVRTLAYFVGITFIIIGVVSVSYSLRNGTSFLHSEAIDQFLFGGRFINTILLSLLFMGMLQFILLITRFFRTSVLINYLAGRYHQPIEEERIFMFLDIRSSTTIAEQLGHYQWHRLLNDFFFDIGEPIYRCKGEIYQYVGDEVVISWSKKDGIENLNCIRCYFLIREKINEREQQYLRRHRVFPDFKAGYHVGKVVAGEIGDFKRDIVFHGDTLNTASRIQEQCNILGRKILISENLLRQLPLEGRYQEEYMGNILLRGKDQELKLFSVRPISIPEQH